MAGVDLQSASTRTALSILRGNKDSANNSSQSLASSLTSDDAPPADGSKLAAEGGFGKFKDRMRRKSMDDRRGSGDSGRRLSTLLSRRNKLKKTASNEIPGQLSVDSSRRNLDLSGNRSDSSLGRELNGSGASSILTDDNAEHEQTPVRPTLSPHPSHEGYLTLSSPEINSQTIPVATGSDVAHPTEAAPNTASSIPQIIEPINLKPLPLAADASSSPVVKQLKSALKLQRKKSTGDTESVKSKDGGGLAALFRSSSRSNSIDGQEGVEALEPNTVEPFPQLESEKSQEQPDESKERPVTPHNRPTPEIRTGSLPSTPTSLVDTPTTYVTPPTPTDPNAEASIFSKRALKSSPPARNRRNSASSDSIKNRRALTANIPSRLSQSIPAPLTPTVEETKTPGGTLTNPAGGFFTSVFSATQKAAYSLGNTIGTSVGSNQKSRSLTSEPVEEQGGEEVIPGSESLPDEDAESRQPAVETLGSGDLNFSHLGILENQGPNPMNSTTDISSQGALISTDGASKKAEEEAAARAVSEAYEKPVANIVSQAHGRGRPLSIASNDRLTFPAEQTPPRSGVSTADEGIKRSGSVRSKISGRQRKHRASSATTGTGNTIAAGLAATATGLGSLAANGSGHRLTGFAVASNKRNKDFHQLFRSVPEDDYLIEDYSAALQRDILLHGRLYVSEGHICFSSNILGWVTNLVMSFDEVVSVEKKSTAVIFPNAIVIQTLHARNTFASFVARDSTYELLVGIWKISHPNLKSSLNGVTLDNAGTGDKTEVAEPEGSEGSSESGSDDEVYDEDADDDAGSFEDGTLAPSIAGSDIGDQALSRKTSNQPITPGAPQTNGITLKSLEGSEAAVTGAAISSDFQGPLTHDPTQCADGSEHYDKLLTDTTIPAPLGKVYSMMFGPASGAFMRKWMVDDQKSRELNFVDDKTGLDNDHKTMTFDYIKPLNAPMGPKQTKCITTNTLVAFDLEKAVTVDCSTQTPDVPSGNLFTTKTRYCLMWGPGNSTRLIANCVVAWTGKSWLRGPIEKGANDGQADYVTALVAALRAAVTTRPTVKGLARKGKRKGKKEVSDAEEANAERDTAVVSKQQESDWGLLEPVHGVLKPIIAILSPFLTSQVVIAVLFAFLFYSWISPPGRAGRGVGLPGYTSPERLAAYEEIWRREESDLWDWLEDRVGLDAIHAPALDIDKRDRQKVAAARSMGKKLEDKRMSERQMDDAIRITEERLSALKDAVARKKARKE